MKLGVNLLSEPIRMLYFPINNLWLPSSYAVSTPCYMGIHTSTPVMLHMKNTYRLRYTKWYMHIHSVFQLHHFEADSLCSSLMDMTKEILLSTFQPWIKHIWSVPWPPHTDTELCVYLCNAFTFWIYNLTLAERIGYCNNMVIDNQKFKHDNCNTTGQLLIQLAMCVMFLRWGVWNL